MSACLYLEMTDGSVTLIRSGEDWKATLNAPQGWKDPAFSDDTWTHAIRYVVTDPTQDPDVGRPWPTGPVKMLRRGFDVSKAIRSARLYATALGAYKFWINGHRRRRSDSFSGLDRLSQPRHLSGLRRHRRSQDRRQRDRRVSCAGMVHHAAAVVAAAL